jgi:type IV secretion system protein TrbL
VGCGPLQFVCNAAGGVVGKAASVGLDAIAKSFGEAAQTLCDWMWSAISATTTIDLTGDWFRSDLGVTAAIGGVLVAALFILQVIKGALRRDPHALARAVTGCAIAFLGAAAAITVTELLLGLVDGLCAGIVHLSGHRSIASIGKDLTRVDVLTGTQLTPALVIALSVFFVIGSVLVWAVFIIRKALIIIAAVFAPVAFGGAPADATRSWVRKWIEFTVAMVFSKLVVVLIFTIALSLLTQPGGGANGLSNLMTGLLLLILASFSPWMVFKLVHFVGGDLVGAHHAAMVSDTRTAASSAVATASRAKGSAQKVFASRGATGQASSAGAAGAAAAPVGAATAAGASAWQAAKTPGRAASAMTDNVSPSAASTPSSQQDSAAGSPGARPRRDPPKVRLSYQGVDWGEAT